MGGGEHAEGSKPSILLEKEGSEHQRQTKKKKKTKRIKNHIDPMLKFLAEGQLSNPKRTLTRDGGK